MRPMLLGRGKRQNSDCARHVGFDEIGPGSSAQKLVSGITEILGEG